MNEWTWEDSVATWFVQSIICETFRWLFGPELEVRLKRIPTFEDWGRFVKEKTEKAEFEKQLKAYHEWLMKLNDWQIIHDYVWNERPEELGPPA